MDIFTLRCGTVLHLQSVRPAAVRHLLLQFGNVDMFEHPEALLELEGKARGRAIEATEKLYNYVAGWGVTDDPPDEALAELEAIGLDVGNERRARADWLRFLEIVDDEEMGELIGAVMILSQRETEESKEESTESGEGD